MSIRPLRTKAGPAVTAARTHCRLRCGVHDRAVRRRGRVRASVPSAACARFSRWARSGLSSWRARATASRTAGETPARLPRSSSAWYSTLTSARAATSLRRRPGTRRRLPEGSPARSGVIFARLEVRNSRASAWLSTSSTVRPARGHRDVLAVHPLTVSRCSRQERVTWMAWCFPPGLHTGRAPSPVLGDGPGHRVAARHGT